MSLTCVKSAEKPLFPPLKTLRVGRLTATNCRAVNLPYVKYWIVKNINTIIIITIIIIIIIIITSDTSKSNF